MKTRFQRLSFAVGLSLIIGAAAGQILSKEACFTARGKLKMDCHHYRGFPNQVKITEYNIPLSVGSAFAVFGLCLMINAFVKEEKQ